MSRRRKVDAAEYDEEMYQREKMYQREQAFHRDGLGLEPVEPEHPLTRQQWLDKRQKAQVRHAQFQQERILYKTRSQWRVAGRMCFVPDSEARKTVTARANGRTLFLFTEDQTRLRTPDELRRDAGVREA